VTGVYRCLQVRIGAVFNNNLFSRLVYQVLGMTSTLLRVEDRLDGESNFLSWNARVTLTLKE
jgi:hypothetical protein